MEHSQANQSQRFVVGFGYCRAAACVAIIVLHAANLCAIEFKRSLTLSAFAGAIATENVMMWAVPCFVMVTGALLLNPAREVTMKKLYRKYIWRVLRALIAFVLIYRVYDMMTSPQGFTVTGLLAGIGQIFTGDTWPQMWYLYTLIGLYLMLPIYRKIVQAATDAELRYLLLIYFIFDAVLPLSQLFGVRINFTIQTTMIYPFYLFAGYAIKNDIVKTDRSVAAILAVGGSVLLVLLTNIQYVYHIQSMHLLRDYNSALIVLIACSLFALFCGVKKPAPKVLHGVLSQIDACSFGIYLTHIIFLKLFAQVLGFNPFLYGHGVSGFFILVVLAFACSFAVTWGFRALVKAVKK